MKLMLSPGIETREVDFSQYAAAVSSCAVGLVGGAVKGPLIPTLITNQAQMIRTFGKPSLSDYGVYSALAILEKADILYYQRIVHEVAGAKAAIANTGGRLAFEMLSSGAGYNDYSIDILTAVPAVAATAKIGSDFPNSEVEVTVVEAGVDGNDYTIAVVEGEPSGALAAVLTVNDLVITLGMTVGGEPDPDKNTGNLIATAIALNAEFTATATGNGNDSIIAAEVEKNFTGGVEIIPVKITLKDDDDVVLETYACSEVAIQADYVETVINGISEYIVVEHTDAGDAITDESIVFAGGINVSTGAYSVAGTDGADKLVFSSLTYDSQINGGKIVVNPLDGNGYTHVLLYAADGGFLEEFYGTLVDTDVDFIETKVNNGSEYITVEYNVSGTNPFPVVQTEFSFSGGADGITGIDAADVIGTGVSGLQAFKNPESISINVLAAPGRADAEVVAEGVSLCEERFDCIFVADPPFGLTPSDVVDWANGTGVYSGDHAAFNSSYGALYWSWLQIYDPYSRGKIWLPPSGYVIAQWAYSDEVGEPWYAPAGLQRGVLTRPLAVEYSPNKGERDVLYGESNIVNPIVNFHQQGIVIYGQKTMKRISSALDRINVRRMLCILRKIVTISSAYIVFEQNDRYTWDRWVDLVTPVMDSFQARRAIYEYKVVMDETTVTPADIDAGRMPGKIYLKPTKAAEFIMIDFILTTTGAEF